MKKKLPLLLLLSAILMQISYIAVAENIDLVTLPTRDGVQLTIYNSEDLTLVRETRSITLKKGENRLQFSWANTLIDPTSVDFRPVEHKEDITLVDAVFPGQKPQHLIWNIDSKYEGQVKVEVSYFTSGLSWAMDYTAIANPEETNLKLKGYVSVLNRSGEEYENAEIRLIVGNVNLVEKIAELAKRKGIEPPAAGRDYDRIKKEAAREMFDKATPRTAAAPGAPAKAPEIVKEGLSEYFMFTIEGLQTVPNLWVKRIQAVNADSVKFDIVYRMRDFQYGPRPVRFYIFENDTERGLGDSPLPDGMLRVFRDNGRDGLAFYASQSLNYVPIRAKIEANLGTDDLVVFEIIKSGLERKEFSFAMSGMREYVNGWDEHGVWSGTVRNYRAKPIKFELRQIWDGDVEYSADMPSTLFDYRTVETIFTVEPRSKKTLLSKTLIHMGNNSKQSRILLK